MDQYLSLTNPSDHTVFVDSSGFFNVNSNSNSASADVADMDNDNSGSDSSTSIVSVDDFSFGLKIVTPGGEKYNLVDRPLMIAPHASIRFGPLTFRPKRRSGLHSAVLVLRNNLTMLEMVKLRGEVKRKKKKKTLISCLSPMERVEHQLFACWITACRFRIRLV